MSQEKRFGKRVALPSTLQIIRELKILMRHDARSAQGDAVVGTGQDDVVSVSANAPSHPDAR